jgi:hypothetical protein
LGAAACASTAPSGPLAVRHATKVRVAATTLQPALSDPRRSTELFVGCADRASCPSAVGMLVNDDDEAAEPERCTATLIARDRALTAIHCLSSSDRRAGAACPHTWLSFPETADAPAEWAACERILIVRGVVNADGLHQEHAVLQLARAVDRSSLAIDPRPIEPNSIVEVVSITPHPIYGTTHELSTRLCRAMDPRPAVAALGAEAAQVGWLANCRIAPGNSGSPVLDREGRIRGMVHGGTATRYELAVTSGF